MFRLRYALLDGALALTACGSTPEERGISGAGIGAAGGAILGAVTGLGVVEGAVIGAAAGGLTGVLTDEETIDLGDPVWKKDSQTPTDQAPYAGGTDAQLVKSIQSGLADMGYDPGPVDNTMGPRTAAAIRQYQYDHDLLSDGQATPELVLHIQEQAAMRKPLAETSDGALN